MVTITTTKSWFSSFFTEYQDDHRWQFDRIKETIKGNQSILEIDDTEVCDDDNNRGSTTYDWFKMVVTTDTDPYGWICDQYDEMDRRRKAWARAYLKGCERIAMQISKKPLDDFLDSFYK